MRSRSFILELLVGLINPFWMIEPRLKRRLIQEDAALLRTAAVMQYFIWTLLWISFYFINDQSKPDLILWRNYRFSIVGMILISAFVAYLFRARASVIRLSLYAVAAIMACGYAWSTKLGQPLRPTWMIAFPTMVLITISNSFVFPATFLSFLVYLLRHYWIGVQPMTWIITDTEAAVFFIMLAYAVKRVWMQTKINKFINDDLAAEAIKQKEAFYRQITSFISPVLIKKIEEESKRSTSLVAAVDSILQRKKKEVAVLYSDMRNFSERSDDLSFIENELVPSAAGIIDPAEKNMGIAKQIGDAILIFYALDDPEEGLLRAMRDAFFQCENEHRRVHRLGRKNPERMFIITYGMAFVGNMASARHREATILGTPANLGSRIDALTKETPIRERLDGKKAILLSEHAMSVVETFTRGWDREIVDLASCGLKIRSYENQGSISLLPLSDNNVTLLNQLLDLNSLPSLTGGENG